MNTLWITTPFLALVLALLESSGFVQAHGAGGYGGGGYGGGGYGGYGNAPNTQCTPEIRSAIALFLSTQNQNAGGNVSPAIAPLFALCFPLFPLIANNNNNNGLAAIAPFLMTGGLGFGGAPALAGPAAGYGGAGYGGAGYGGGGY